VLVFQNSLLYPGIDPLVGGLSGTYECIASYSCDALVGGAGAGPTRYILASNAEFAAAPLPSTWSMLIAGFVGLVGFVAFGGKKRNASALASA